MAELLSPAGSLKNMRYAFAYGADAVYAGQPRYSLRVRNNEFDHDNLKIGIDEAHALGKKFYVVVNIQPHNAKLKTFIRDLEPVVAMQPDALIMSDPGIIMMVREHFPDMPIHLSVQANAVNWATVKFWKNYGISRVILSRELSIEEITEIHTHVPDIELEVFVHGALCMAYSGRCLLSGYMNKRDANQGACTNACRWDYQVHPAQENETGEVVLKSSIQKSSVQKIEPVLLQQGDKPELMEMDEDEHGAYIMNSKDLRAVQHVEHLLNIGVESLKIEGRTKSYFYCARTAQVYRKAIDDAVAGKPFDQTLMTTLEGLAHRGYTEGFLRRHVHQEYQNYETGSSRSFHQQFVGEILDRDGDYVRVAVKNKFLLGDRLELMTPQGNHIFVLEEMLDKNHQPVSEAKGDGHIVKIPVEQSIAIEYALLMRFLPEVSNLDHIAVQACG
ncbi:MAG: tRNA 5-hydroxyuridine modification protein YegQ [Acinetobacter populi]|jgi:putative protease|uniref:prephenate-dependent tRNA uridine(34) hydroxylase TrhP n=1 Tax=Acinetobacter populi TaxID=1582270 RepID=UPI002357B803|nr:tRNA 5-hydroxyuridine modification protein YegQ [Acinetobacter populi]MCH4247218.1 tRNA 5-hydroxyuridine modification protein YegQ [Acinetobacter populi]